MADILIERSHTLGKSGAGERVRRMEGKLKERYGIALDWQGERAQIKGTGVSGAVEVEDDRLRIEVKLGFLLTPMAGKIREMLEQQVDKVLA